MRRWAGHAIAGWLGALAIAACGCGDLAVTPPRGPSDLLGWVRDELGNPYTNLRVRIGGATPGIAPDGSFLVRQVTPPYDLIIEANPRRVFQEVSSLDPVIQLPGTASPQGASAYVTGRVPWQAGQYTTALCFGEGIEGVATQVRDATGAYLLEPRWSASIATRWVTLILLQHASSQRYETFVQRTLQIAPHGRTLFDATARDFAPIGPRSFEVEVLAPAGSLLRTHAFPVIALSPQRWLGLDARLATSGGIFYFVLPAGPDLPLQIWAAAEGFRQRSEARIDLPSDRARMTIALRAPATLTAPADSAIVRMDGALEWTDVESNGVYEVRVDALGRGSVIVYTVASRIPLAELPFEGGLKPETLCRWQVTTLGGASRVDDLLTHPGLAQLRNRAFAYGAERSFTIAASDSARASAR
jgi:hypothetical protein